MPKPLAPEIQMPGENARKRTEERLSAMRGQKVIIPEPQKEKSRIIRERIEGGIRLHEEYEKRLAKPAETSASFRSDQSRKEFEATAKEILEHEAAQRKARDAQRAEWNRLHPEALEENERRKRIIPNERVRIKYSTNPPEISKEELRKRFERDRRILAQRDARTKIINETERIPKAEGKGATYQIQSDRVFRHAQKENQRFDERKRAEAIDAQRKRMKRAEAQRILRRMNREADEVKAGIESRAKENARIKKSNTRAEIIRRNEMSIPDIAFQELGIGKTYKRIVKKRKPIREIARDARTAIQTRGQIIGRRAGYRRNRMIAGARRIKTSIRENAAQRSARNEQKNSERDATNRMLSLAREPERKAILEREEMRLIDLDKKRRIKEEDKAIRNSAEFKRMQRLEKALKPVELNETNLARVFVTPEGRS
ncbi:MAG: hypothetical protein Q7K42_00735, partial [Candidatus Diapherotrites archaeon]|nr:hypothetical protein [Candidatus Diapherotrites archaeon]